MNDTYIGNWPETREQPVSDRALDGGYLNAACACQHEYSQAWRLLESMRAHAAAEDQPLEERAGDAVVPAVRVQEPVRSRRAYAAVPALAYLGI